MFETGARIGQATAIAPEEFDAANMRVWMPAAKGVEAQWVRLSPELTAELASLPVKRIRPRRKGQRPPAPKLFGYAAKDGVYRKWHRVCDRAAIPHIMPHAAGRHGFGTEMIVRQGLDPRSVAKAGRWSDPSIVLNTYTHSDDAEDRVQAAIRTSRVQHQNRKQSKSLKGTENASDA